MVKIHPGRLATAAISKDNVIFCDSANYVIALDTSGKTLWKCIIPNSQNIEHSVVLDDNDNIYFEHEVFGVNDWYACSIDKSGNLRWTCFLPAYWWGYPGPVLSPNGNLFGAPKRPYLIFTIK